MKILIKTQECDEWGNCYNSVSKEKPLDNAYQDTYVVTEHSQVQTTEKRVSRERIKHDGKTFFSDIATYKTTPNPKIEEWGQRGYGHTYKEITEVWMKEGDTIMNMTRRIDRPEWFIDIDTLEEFVALFESGTVNPEIEFGHDCNLEDNIMVLVVS